MDIKGYIGLYRDYVRLHWDIYTESGRGMEDSMLVFFGGGGGVNHLGFRVFRV